MTEELIFLFAMIKVTARLESAGQRFPTWRASLLRHWSAITFVFWVNSLLKELGFINDRVN